jgi:hypothetical protein
MIVDVLSVTEGRAAVAGAIDSRNLEYPGVVISMRAAMVVSSPGSVDSRATYLCPVSGTQAEPFHVWGTPAPLTQESPGIQVGAEPPTIGTVSPARKFR